ncbi:MAG TPA: Hsp70 family protein [Sandaracinaceae bacterium]
MFVDRPVGIDLGTTNSEIALLDPSEKEILVYADRFGRRTIPSAVAWDPKKGELVVGRAARNRRGTESPPVESIKRKMGRDEKVRIGPHELTPEEVSSKILAELRARMCEDLVEKSGGDVRVDRAVITVPAYFDAPQVEATRRAGELAGFEVLGILQEPTAAAIYHTWKRKLGDGCFLIYDLGGGTFDVSILRCLAGEYQVLAIDGDNYLGGDDFDRRFAERLRRMLAERGYALDLDVARDPEDQRRFLRLVHLAQEIKESLSTSEVVHVSKQNVLTDREGEPVDFEADVGRADWEEAVRDLVDTTMECCRRAIAQATETAGVGLGDIDHVVLVGGSTRVPYVVRRVTEELAAKTKTGEAPLQDEVDTCVALGAAVHAAQLGGLRLGDDRTVVCVRSPLVGRGASLRLTLDVERAPEGAASIGVRADGAVVARSALERVPAERVRLDVPLGEAAENPAELVVADASEAELAALPFALYRGDVRPRSSGLSQPSVLAKDIALEVVRAGKRERKVLLARGTGLPAEATHTFYTGDKSGAVVLRLLQGRLPIKTLMIAVDKDLPIGTPVDLTLRCDEAMRLEAKAVVAGQELWAHIEPVPAKTRGLDEVEALLARAEATANELWGYDARFYRSEVEPLVVGIREVAQTDPDKLAALCAKLEHLLDSYAGDPEGLSPPMHRFEAVLDALRRKVYRANGPLLGMDTAAWEERIADILQRGLRAWEENDAGAWRRTYNEAQALLETAGEQEFSKLKLDDPAYITKSLIDAIAYAKRVEHALADFVPSSADEVREMQLAERDRLLAALEQNATVPLSRLGAENLEPHEVRRQLDRIFAEIERIDVALERLPSIGLVTDRRRG